MVVEVPTCVCWLAVDLSHHSLFLSVTAHQNIQEGESTFLLFPHGELYQKSDAVKMVQEFREHMSHVHTAQVYTMGMAYKPSQII